MMPNHSTLLLINITQNHIGNPLREEILSIFSCNLSLIPGDLEPRKPITQAKKGRMNSVCISSCVDDARVPVRATYRNLYKWPESDAEFVRSVSSNSNGSSSSNNNNRGVSLGNPIVVNSISCRQMFLRSYTFSRKETVPERTVKFLGGGKQKVAHKKQRKQNKRSKGRSGKRCVLWRKVKKMSRAALFRIFHRLLSCTTSIDVSDH